MEFEDNEWIDIGLVRGYRHPRTGEVVIDEDSGGRVNGAEDLDFAGVSGEDLVQATQVELGISREAAIKRLRRMKEQEDKHDARIATREHKHDQQYNERVQAIVRRVKGGGVNARDYLEGRSNGGQGGRGSRGGERETSGRDAGRGNKMSSGRWSKGMLAGVSENCTAADQAKVITINVANYDKFTATDLTFKGSTDANSVVTQIWAAGKVVWNEDNGIPTAIFDSQGFIRDILSETDATVRGGMVFKVYIKSGGGTEQSPVKTRVTLIGKGLQLQSKGCR